MAAKRETGPENSASWFNYHPFEISDVSSNLIGQTDWDKFPFRSILSINRIILRLDHIIFNPIGLKLCTKRQSA